jgi:large subunit ribosomal protein L17
MNHHRKNKIFGRKTNERRALLRSLICSLIRDEKIITTEAKAKALRPLVEELVTKAKKDNLASRRIVDSKLGRNPKISKKLFEEIMPQYKDRNGGYTRITKLPLRSGDAAKMVQIEFVK